MFDYFDDIISDAFFSPLYKTRGLRVPTRSSEMRSTVNGDQLTISIDVPGSRKDDVEITFESGNVMKVVAKRQDLDSTSTYRYTVPEAWDRDSADAKLEDGVLTILLTKREREKSRKLLVK